MTRVLWLCAMAVMVALSAAGYAVARVLTRGKR